MPAERVTDQLATEAGTGDTTGRYDAVTIALHWTTAVLVVLQWSVAQVQAQALVPRGPARHALWSTHIAFGALLAVVLLVRLIWRAGPGRRLPAADRGLVHAFAKASHWGLYLLLIAVVTLGIANVAVRGWDLFGLVQIPPLSQDRELRSTVNGWHELAANTLVILAALHAAAALVHHYLWRDGVLRRMLPWPSRG